MPYTYPTVTTQAATGVTSNSCVGHGNVSNWGGGPSDQARGFCYMVGTSGDPNVGIGLPVFETVSGSPTGAFSLTIYNLQPDTNYRIRAFAYTEKPDPSTPWDEAYVGYGTTVQITTGPANYTLSFADGLSLSDAIVKNIGKINADAVTIADVFSRVATFQRSFSDSLTITDVIAKLYEKNTTDSITLADTLSKVMAYHRGFADGVSLADGMNIAMLGKHFLSFAEALSLVDSISKEIELSKADVAALTDTFSSATTFNRSLADGLTLTDSATLAKIQLLTLTILAKSMVVGVQQQIKVMGLYSDGSVQDATAYCQFVSSNTDVATIDSSGLVMGISVGLAIITATIGIVTTTYTLAILPAVSAVIPKTGIVAFADGNTYRAGTYLSRRFEYKHNSIGAIKVLASKYPVTIDLIFPDIPYTISVTVISKKPQRVKAFLSEAVEVRINAAEEVSAVFLASNMSEFPT
jgi:hypothetical protein